MSQITADSTLRRSETFMERLLIRNFPAIFRSRFGIGPPSRRPSSISFAINGNFTDQGVTPLELIYRVAHTAPFGVSRTPRL